MSNTSKPATTRKPAAKKTQVTEPVAVPKDVAVTRSEGDVFASTNGQILMETGNGLRVLYSKIPVQNIHPALYTEEEYQRLIDEKFGSLTKIHTV